MERVGGSDFYIYKWNIEGEYNAKEN